MSRRIRKHKVATLDRTSESVTPAGVKVTVWLYTPAWKVSR